MKRLRNVTLLGFAVDEGVRRNNGRVGVRDGPRAVRDAMKRLPLLQERPLSDGGDTVAIGEDLEQAQQQHALRVADALHAQTLPLSVGGGHEVAWATFQGLAMARPALRRILALNFDAHFDLRTAPHSTSGTSFRQMYEWCSAHQVDFAYRVIGLSEFSNATDLFASALNIKAQWWTDESLQTPQGVRTAVDALTAEVQRYDDEHDAVYVSVCLDVLPGADAPRVSAPAALGVRLGSLERLLDASLNAPNLCAVDIAELNPTFDQDNQTARIAARLAARIIRAIRGIPPAP